MRFLIVASVLAYAAASPSGLLAAPYALAPALPTISAGDINGAAIEAHVAASDHVRAAYDATRQLNDKVNELHGQAINNAEESAWKAVDNVKTVEARLDGAAAAAAPILSKQLVGGVAPIASYAAPVAYSAPVASYAAAPVVQSYAAPVPYAQYAAPYAAPYAANPFVASPYSYSPIAYSQAW